MMAAAERDGEFVTDLHPHRPGLGKAQMMRIGWLSPADKAWLRGYKLQVIFVPKSLGFGEGQGALVYSVKSVAF